LSTDFGEILEGYDQQQLDFGFDPDNDAASGIFKEISPLRNSGNYYEYCRVILTEFLRLRDRGNCKNFVESPAFAKVCGLRVLPVSDFPINCSLCRCFERNELKRSVFDFK